MLKRYWLYILTLGGFMATAALIIWTAAIYRQFQRTHQAESYQPGVSYSIEYAHELGLDSRQAYLGLLDDLHVRRFRLMSYWDLIEPKPGQYDFSELDFEMSQAAQAGAKVSLAIGLRQPRWPECHQPDWAAQLSDQERQASLEQFMSRVVERYRSSTALESYQLENEALNRVFGTCSKGYGRSQLEEEFNLVKGLDPNHPIIVNVSNEFGLPLGSPRGDQVGFSIYRHIYDSTITHRYVHYLFPAWWFTLRAALIEHFEHRPVMIHELQTEPWGPGATVNLSIDEQNKSMTAEGILESVHYAKATGIRRYYLWGGEWWYWRLIKFHDRSLWEAARQVFGQ